MFIKVIHTWMLCTKQPLVTAWVESVFRAAETYWSGFGVVNELRKADSFVDTK